MQKRQYLRDVWTSEGKSQREKESSAWSRHCFWSPTSFGSFIELKAFLFSKMYLHSGCKQKQTCGREGEQLVPSNSPSCATINTLLWHLTSQGTPKSNRVPLCCSAAAPGVGCEAALAEIRQAAVNAPMGTVVHKAVSQDLWYGHKIRAKNCQT